VTRLGLELHQEAVGREEHPVQKRGGGLFGGRCGNALRGGWEAKGDRQSPRSASAEKGAGDTVALWSDATHQRRRDALVEAAEALLARDGRERMQSGVVSNAQRRVLEPVFNLVECGMDDGDGGHQSEKREFERGKSEGFGSGSAHRYRKESRRLDLRRLRLSRRESRALGRGGLLWSGVVVCHPLVLHVP